MNQVGIYKIVLIGDTQTGKTSFVTRHLTGNFLKDHVPTLGVEVHPLEFHTNYGKIIFNIWDTAGEEKFGGLKDGYYVGANGAISFYTNDTKKRGKEIEASFTESRPNAHVVRVWHKCDLTDEAKAWNKHVRSSSCRIHYQVSAKSCYNFEKPFLELARKLTNHSDLVFISSPIE